MLFSCHEITEKASDYVDKELTRWQRFKVRVHLMMCVHCRRYIRQFRLMIASLAGFEKPPEPNDKQVDEIVAMLERQAKEQPQNPDEHKPQ